MTTLLEKAITELKNLPEGEQDRIARELLDVLASDRRWDALFADPRSESLLKSLADEARDDIARGDVFDFDPASRPVK